MEATIAENRSAHGFREILHSEAMLSDDCQRVGRDICFCFKNIDDDQDEHLKAVTIQNDPHPDITVNTLPVRSSALVLWLPFSSYNFISHSFFF